MSVSFATPKAPSGSLRALDAGGTVLTFQHNPEEVRDREVARWANIKIHGVHNPRFQYSSGDGRTISFTLRLYHVSDSGWTPDEQIRFLRSLVYPDLSGGIPTRPPTRVMLSMGPAYPGVVCVVMDVEAVSTQWDVNLNTTYAEVSITMVEFSIRAIGWQDVR